MDNDTKIKNCLDGLEKECKELLYYNTNVPTISTPVDPLFFHREFVSKNLPVVIKDGCKYWPAVGKWNIEYFRSQFPHKSLRVAVTPNGLADAVVTHEGKEWFGMPEEVEMTMTEFLDNLDTPKDNYVCYLQRQNSNLTEEMSELLPDVQELRWATQAFGKPPDAINLWMGDRRAITSMHKDPYENMYCVVDGQKRFTLVPAAQRALLPHGMFTAAEYAAVTGHSYRLVPRLPAHSLPWVALDPRKPRPARASLYHVTVRSGDCLYLPALWFHHVAQSHACIAVNYWYDMDYDIKYCYYKLLEEMCTYTKQ